jgi:hypothetical protein
MKIELNEVMMEITQHNMVFSLTVKDVGVWMAALSRAATTSTVQIFPWDSCPFLKQHAELVRLTGYGAGDHKDLRAELEAKWGK